MIGVKVPDQTDKTENVEEVKEVKSTSVIDYDNPYFREHALDVAVKFQSAAGNIDNLLENADRILKYIATGEVKPNGGE